MKKVLLVLSMAVLLAITGIALAQDQQPAAPQPQKDTVNMDTDAKPTYYYAVEDENANETNKKGGSGTTIAIICGAVVIVAGVAFFLLKKKK